MAAKIGTMKRTPEEFYPDLSKRLGEEGRVLVSTHVAATGCAVDFAISSSSGSAQLDEAAQRFAETIEFVPAEKGGKAVDAVKQFFVTFKLTDDGPPEE